METSKRNMEITLFVCDSGGTGVIGVSEIGYFLLYIWEFNPICMDRGSDKKKRYGRKAMTVMPTTAYEHPKSLRK